MKKKWLSILLGMVMVLSLTGCADLDQTISNLQESSSDSKESVEITEVATDDLFTDADYDTSYDDCSTIVLSDSGCVAEKKSVNIDDTTVTITKGGTYLISGELSEGQIVVDAEDEKVRLVLDGVTITNDDSACIYIPKADKVFITTTAGSVNTLTTSGDFVQTDDNNIDGTIYCKSDLTLNGEGTLNVTCATKHCVVSKDNLAVTSGDYVLTASTDGKGLQGKDSVKVGGGNISIPQCYEGIEGLEIYITDGNIDITAEDDGLNASKKDDDGNSFFSDPMQGDSDCKLYISGGVLNVDAKGDGLDSNGLLSISGGEAYVSGSTNGGNAALDPGTDMVITGGTLAATGYSTMAESFSTDSTQGNILYTFDSSLDADTTVTLSDESGNVLISYTAPKDFDCITFSCAAIVDGGSYTVTAGDYSETITMDGLSYGEAGMMGGGFGGGHGGGDHDGQFPGGGNMNPGDMDMSEITPGAMPDMSEVTPGVMPDGSSMPDDMQMPDSNDRGGRQQGGQTPPDKPDSSSN